MQWIKFPPSWLLIPWSKQQSKPISCECYSEEHLHIFQQLIFLITTWLGLNFLLPVYISWSFPVRGFYILMGQSYIVRRKKPKNKKTNKTSYLKLGIYCWFEGYFVLKFLVLFAKKANGDWFYISIYNTINRYMFKRLTHNQWLKLLGFPQMRFQVSFHMKWQMN